MSCSCFSAHSSKLKAKFMDNRIDKRLSSLFKQLGQKREQVLPAEPLLKKDVFNTIDTTALIADIIDLFTFKFLESHATMIDAFPENTYGGKEKQADSAFKYYVSKIKDKPIIESDEDFADFEK